MLARASPSLRILANALDIVDSAVCDSRARSSGARASRPRWIARPPSSARAGCRRSREAGGSGTSVGTPPSVARNQVPSRPGYCRGMHRHSASCPARSRWPTHTERPMPYPLKPGTMYMMPTHFGPMTGPRQGPGGEVGAFPHGPAQDHRHLGTLPDRGGAARALPAPGIRPRRRAGGRGVRELHDRDRLARGSRLQRARGAGAGPLRRKGGPRRRSLPDGAVGEPCRSDPDRPRAARLLEDLVRAARARRVRRRDALLRELARFPLPRRDPPRHGRGRPE